MKFFLLMVFAVIQLAAFNLTVSINNSSGHTISIGVYDKKENFLIKGKSLAGRDLKQKKFIFQDLKKGIYAVAVYEDLNENRKLDKNFFGIPNEPYGFSNNVKPSFGAPSFEKCSFKLDQDKEITIGLIQ